MKRNENEEEWIEITVECPDCIQGRVAHWKDSRTGKHPWRYLSLIHISEPTRPY